MTNQTARLLQHFYRTGPLPCPYIPGQVERNLFTEMRGPGAPALHDQLAKAGFRRSHHIAYRPSCPSCNACVPVRVDVAGYRPRRSHRRIVARNGDLVAAQLPASATREQYALFRLYQRQRHSGGEMSAMSFADYHAMVEDSSVETHVIEFRSADTRLRACCLLDRLGDGLSAVYSFYDPGETTRSLGTLMVLDLIRRARESNLQYVYLGYWIAASDKMAYKTRFNPLQALGRSGWKPWSGGVE